MHQLTTIPKLNSQQKTKYHSKLKFNSKTNTQIQSNTNSKKPHLHTSIISSKQLNRGARSRWSEMGGVQLFGSENLPGPPRPVSPSDPHNWPDSTLPSASSFTCRSPRTPHLYKHAHSLALNNSTFSKQKLPTKKKNTQKRKGLARFGSGSGSAAGEKEGETEDPVTETCRGSEGEESG